MTNSRTKTNLKIITVGHVQRRIPISATIFTLFDQCAQASTADAMKLSNISSAVTPYQVTTGKTFHLCGVIITKGAISDGNIVTFFQGDTEDAETASKLIIAVEGTGSGTDKQEIAINGLTIASAKFLTVKPSGTNINHILVIGYEI